MNKFETVKLFIRKHLILFVVATLAVVAAFLYINRYLLRLGAAQPPVAISFNPATGNFPTNQSQTTTMIIQTDNIANKIEGFDITLQAGGNLNFLNASKPTAIGSTDETLYELEFFRLISPQTIRLSYSTLKASSLLPNGIQITITYQGTGTGSGTITLDQTIGGNGQPVSKVTGNVTGQTYDFGTPGTGNYTFSGPTPNLSFSPTTGNYTVGQQFNVQVLLDTAGLNVSNTDAVISYDINALRAVSVTPGTVFFDYNGIGGGSNYIDNVNGKIKIGGAIEPQIPPITPIPVNGSGLQFATITFEALSAVNTDVTFDFIPGDRNDSNIVELSTNNDILASVNNAQFTLAAAPTPTTPPATGTPPPTPIPTATPIPPTSTPVPTATPVPPTNTPVPTQPPAAITLNLTIRLEGRTWVGATNSRNVNVCVKNTAICAPTATTNNQGQANNIALTGLTTGSYTILVKPEGFLQKAVTLNLVSGSNVLDMIGTPFLAGDISGDNFVNNADYTPLTAAYFLSQTLIQPYNTNGDFDGSGQINGLDFSLMLKNWNVLGEE